MSRQIERLVWFSAGILINSFGIVLITKGALGTSQISSIPYVLSLQLPSISFGMFSFIMNMVYIVLQALLLRRQFKPIQLLQIVVNVVFSASIDVFMAMLSFYAPQQLFTRVLSAIAGCIVLTGTDLSAGRAVGITACVAASLLQAADADTLRVFRQDDRQRRLHAQSGRKILEVHKCHFNPHSLFFVPVVPVGEADCRFARRGKSTICKAHALSEHPVCHAVTAHSKRTR